MIDEYDWLSLRQFFWQGLQYLDWTGPMTIQWNRFDGEVWLVWPNNEWLQGMEDWIQDDDDDDERKTK